MTNCYKYLPTKSTKHKFCIKRRHTRQYLFAVLLLSTIILMSLYEFYFNIIERSKGGDTETNILEAVLCQKNNPVLQQLRNKVEEINKAQLIRNFDGYNISDQTIVIVVQVHKRAAYLEKLIHSLSAVADVNSSLLVFSHDYFSEEINNLVHAIDFAPVMQIFFPFSVQLYPHEFPGTSPKDCVWDLPLDLAQEQGCVGANTPDAYGHFRQGQIVQTKHHWWWKLNTVFDELNITKKFNGYMMFLEEDHYVTPDFLFTLRLMIDFSTSKCPECNSFHLGNFKSSHSYIDDANKVDLAPWNNLGFSFNRTIWNALHACSSVFCTFDDYNWDWSFAYASQECFYQRKVTSLVVKTTRVFHVGVCGMHHKDADCDSEKLLNDAKGTVESMKPYLFPQSLQLESTHYYQPKVVKGWGGWSDPRDIQLCLNISSKEGIS